MLYNAAIALKKPFLLLLAALAIIAAASACACRKEYGAVPAEPDGNAPQAAGSADISAGEEIIGEDLLGEDIIGEDIIMENNADYIIRKINGGPDWEDVPALPIGRVLWTEDAGIRAEGRLCHDGERLYVRMRAFEEDIRAVNTAPMSPVYEDSCLEFFFMCEGSDNYFNFEINPNGCLCVQYGPDRYDRTYLVREDSAEYFDIRADRIPDGWEVSYSIPASFIAAFCPDFSFERGIRANMYKCGDKTAVRHYLSWMPVGTEKPDFHRPEFFGTLRFEG